MKRFTIFLGVLLSIIALKQAGGSAKVNSNCKILPDSSLTIIDGKVYKGNANNVSPRDIISVDILKAPRAIEIYGKDAVGGATVIITKTYAIAAYQKKFSAFSKKYKDYIELKHDDSNLQYVLNNTIMNVKRKSAIRALYQLSADSIKKVEFKRVAQFITDDTVIITTKTN
jgi:hypothetical protein